MAAERKGSGRKTKIVLKGFKQGDEYPEIEVGLIDHRGNAPGAVTIGEDGAFNLPASTVEKAQRIRIGPGGEASEETPSSIYLNYRAADFKSVLDAGILNIGQSVHGCFFGECECEC